MVLCVRMKELKIDSALIFALYFFFRVCQNVKRGFCLQLVNHVFSTMFHNFTAADEAAKLARPLC